MQKPLIQKDAVSDPKVGSLVVSILGTIFTICSVVISVVILGVALSQPSSVNRYYLTSTFYTTYASDLPQLTWNPSGADNFDALTQVSFRCLQAATVGPCPTDANYTSCTLAQSPAFRVCTQNRTAVIPSAVYANVWSCAAASFSVSQGKYSAYTLCSGQESSPAVLDVMQDVYTGTMLGSYNWMMMLVTSQWLMSSFAVYTVWFGNDGSGVWSRTGVFWCMLGFVWNVSAVAFLSASAWRASSSGGNVFVNYNAPMSVQTTTVCMGFSLIAMMYLVAEYYEASEKQRENRQPAGPDAVTTTTTTTTPSRSSPGASQKSAYMSPPWSAMQSKYLKRRSSFPLRHFMRAPYFIRAPKGFDVAAGVALDDGSEVDITPLLMTAWADCWILVDPMLTIAFVGVSSDVVTAEVCNIFTSVLYARVCFSAFQRLAYEAYHRPAGNFANRNYGVSVMATLANFASIWFVVVPSMLMLWRYKAVAITTAFVSLVYIIPAIYWVVVNAMLEFVAGTSPRFYAEIGFVWGLAVRAMLGFALLLTYGIGSSNNVATNNELEHLIKEFTVNG